MTISTAPIVVRGVGDGGTTSYPFGHKVFDSDDVLVVHYVVATGVETTWVKDTHYTIDENDVGTDTGVTVVVKTTPTDYTPATGENLYIFLNLPFTQGTTFPSFGKFSPTTIEQALDEILQRQAMLKEELDRTWKLPVAVTLTDIAIPAPEAGKAVIWNSGATGLENTTLAVESLPDPSTSNDYIRGDGASGYELRTVAQVLSDISAAASSHNHATTDITSGTFADGRVAESNVTQHEAAIDHDALTNFVADEHIAHSGVTLTAGEGLTGGGTIAASRSFGLAVNSLTAEATVDGAADYFVMYDASAGGHRKVLGDDLPGGAITSVFTRTGAVVAAASDYDASQIDNDSSVTGAFVDDALNTLNSGKAATSHAHALGDLTGDSDDITEGATQLFFTTAEQSKLAGIEAAADVTDAANVAAAGAVMDGDFSANGLMERTGAGAYTVATVTAAGKALLDDASVAAQRTTLGLGTIATQAASAVAITGGAIDGTAIGGTTPAAGTFSSLTLELGAGNLIVNGTNIGMLWHETDNDVYVQTLFNSSKYRYRALDSGLSQIAAGFVLDCLTGAFGINETSPAYGLEITGSITDGYFAVTDTTNGDIFEIDSSGNVAVDTDGLYYDRSNGRLGLGTDTPTQEIHVYHPTAGPKLLFETPAAKGSGFNFDSGHTAANSAIGTFTSLWSGNSVGQLRFMSGADTVNKDDGRMYIRLAIGGTLYRRFSSDETETLINEDGADLDFRVAGDTLTHALFLDASAATENIALLTGSAPNWQSMDGGMFLGNASTIPTGNPSSGGFLFVEAGALKFRGSSGTVTTLAAA